LIIATSRQCQCNLRREKINGSGGDGAATTGSNGAAVYKLRVKKQDPVGTYQVGAVAKKDALSGSAATQFTMR
jgi:hypothetical protein